MREPQKALHLYIDEDKARPKHVGQTYVVMEKFDGWYMYIDCINGVWQDITSRSLNVISSMQEYTKLFKDTIPVPKKDCRLIFEGIVYDDNNFPTEFKTVNGWFNRKAPIHKKVTLKCHDFVVLGEEDEAFEGRYSNLKAMMRAINRVDPNLLLTMQIVPWLDCSSNPEDWKNIYEQVVRKYNNNGEGVILKRVDAPYSYKKKNADILKIKCEKSFELRVVGIEEGEGKYVGTLGKLVVQDAVGNINKVSGMTDAERDLWYNDPTLILQKIVEVQCMKVLSNKSLREGRYKAIRHDKDYPDEL